MTHSRKCDTAYLHVSDRFLIEALALGARCIFAVQRPSMTQCRRKPARTRTSSFTIVEVLVCIGIICLLISLAFPGLAMARGAARRTTSLSHLRQHGSTFAMYNADWSDCFPFFAVPIGETVIRCQLRPRIEVMRYYHFSYELWNYALADQYYNGEWASKLFYGPGYPAGYPDVTGLGGPTTYWYACSFIARPEFWNESSRVGIEQRRPTRLGEVLFPSLKNLLFSGYPLDIELAKNATPSPLLSTECQFVDGSAEIRLSRFLPGYPVGDGLLLVNGAVHPSDFPWAFHTTDGVRGRDVPSR